MFLQTYRHAYVQTDRQADGQTYGQAYGQADVQMGRQTYGQAYRQACWYCVCVDVFVGE